MEPITHHHHFKKDLIPLGDRVARCERYVIDVLLTSDIPDSQRENSIAWELKHHSGVTQMARLLARKRGLQMDVCTIGALLHDIYAIIYGKYRDHAHLGAPIALQIANEIGGFTPQELNLIHQIVYDHSDKDVWSRDAYREFGKDADILDVFLYPGPFPEYLLIKSLPVFKHYLQRATNVWDELGLPPDPRFDLLENYGDRWFTWITRVNPHEAIKLLSTAQRAASLPKEVGACPPAFCILPTTEPRTSAFEIFANRESLDRYIAALAEPHDEVNCWLSECKDVFESAIHRNPIKLNHSDCGSFIWSDAPALIDRLRADGSCLVLWPLADVYEVIADPRTAPRSLELGLPV